MLYHITHNKQHAIFTEEQHLKQCKLTDKKFYFEFTVVTHHCSSLTHLTQTCIHKDSPGTIKNGILY